jgi:hypothetical protein
LPINKLINENPSRSKLISENPSRLKKDFKNDYNYYSGLFRTENSNFLTGEVAKLTSTLEQKNSEITKEMIKA